MKPTPRNLRIIRKNMGFTLESLSKKAEVSMSAIGNFETGARGMSEENVKKIAEVLHSTPSEISRPLEKSQDVTYGGDPEAPRPQQYRYVPPGIEGVAKSLHACVVAGDACAALIMLDAIGPPLREAAKKQEAAQRQNPKPPAGP